MNPGFWGVLDELVASSRVVVDRPKGSSHSRFLQNTSALEAGFLEGATSGDGQGTDVWLVSGDPHQMTAVLCAAELKRLLGGRAAEQQTVTAFLNGHAGFQGLLLPRP